MISGFKHKVIIVGFIKGQPETIRSYIVADNDKRADSIVNQIKMKFWDKEVEQRNTVFYVAMQPFRMRDGRESSAATSKIADYNIESEMRSLVLLSSLN